VKGGLFITAEDILILTGGTCKNSAYREHRKIRKALGKKTSRLSIEEYCKYWEFDVDEIARFLDENR
jgi:hypothetical protein